MSLNRYQNGVSVPARTTSAKRAGGGAPSLRQRALRLLARREHSRAELLDKLTVYAPSVDELARLLDEFTAKGYIDEGRVAQSVVRQQAGRYGLRRVSQTLQRKGVDAEFVAPLLLELADSEVERARSLWQRRFGAPPQSAKEHARQARFLMGRGFDTDVVKRVLRLAVKGPASV